MDETRLKGGLLKKEEKETFLELVRNGYYPTQAAKFLSKSFATIANTELKDPKFAKALDEAKGMGLAQMCEETLLELAEGRATIVTSTYTPVYDENGQPVLNPDGSKQMRLIRERRQQLPQDKQAALIYLQAYKASKYGPKAADAPATMGEDIDPATLAADLAERFSIEMHENQPNSTHGLDSE